MKATELTGEFRALSERGENLRRDQQAGAADIKKLEASIKAVETDVVLLRQRLDDHLKRYEQWEARRWALVMALIGAVLSLASGLIVTLARTTPK